MPVLLLISFHKLIWKLRDLHSFENYYQKMFFFPEELETFLMFILAAATRV